MSKIVGQFKKGWRTSEFYVALITPVGAIVLIIFDLEIDAEALAVGIASTIQSASYILGRSWLKSRRVTALAAAGAAEVPPRATVESWEGNTSPAVITPAGDIDFTEVPSELD
jgi:hypothetical protein